MLGNSLRMRLALIFALVFVLVLGAMPAPVPIQAQNTDCYHAQGGNLWVCDNGGTMEFQSGATLDVQSGATISLDTFLTIVPQTVLTLTVDGDLEPTGTFQPIAAAGAIGLSGANIAAGNDGDLLILLNIGSDTITITETTGLVSAGNIVLGEGDS